MAKIFRFINKNPMITIHHDHLPHSANHGLTLHSKEFRSGHYIFSVRDGFIRNIITEWSQSVGFPKYGCVIFDPIYEKYIHVTAREMYLARSGYRNYPKLSGTVVDYDADVPFIKYWIVGKIILKSIFK